MLMSDVDKTFNALLKAELEEREAEAQTFRSLVTTGEKQLSAALIKIFKSQKQEVKDKLNTSKHVADMYVFDTSDWEKKTRVIAEKYCKTAMNANGQRVYTDLGKMEEPEKIALISATYDMEYPEAIAYIEEQGIKLASVVTAETEKLIADLISMAFIDGLSVTEIASLIDNIFDDDTRALAIARTEIVRASNYGTLSAYKQSGVVESKEWLTAQDELVCPFCSHLNRKTIGLDDSFLPIGGSLEAIDINGKTHTLTNDYLDTQAPPVHPRCRCTLIPVVKRI